MIVPKFKKLFIILISLLIYTQVLVTLLASAQEACPEPVPGIGTITYHELILFQGDDPATNDTEPADIILASDRSRWVVPWNASHVFVSVPEDATHVAIHDLYYDGSQFGPGGWTLTDEEALEPQYTLVTEGDHAGFYRWNFPPNADRNYTFGLRYNTTDVFAEYDALLTNSSHWTVQNDTLSLVPGVAFSNYTSKVEEIGHEISAVNISIGASNEQNISFFISADNGTNWSQIVPGQRIEFRGGGNQMRFRMMMEQDVLVNNTPVIDNITITMEYIPEFLDFWLQTDYHLEIQDSGLEIELHLTYDMPALPFYYIGYFDQEMRVGYDGLNVSATSFETLPGKAVHMTMGEERGDCVHIHIMPPDAGSDFDISLIITIAFVLFTVGLAAYFINKKSTEESADGEAGEDDEENADNGAVGESAGEGENEKLRRRKQTLEKMIEKLTRDEEEGAIGMAAASRMTEKYRNEIMEIDGKLDDEKSNDRGGLKSAEIESLEAKKAELVRKLRELAGRFERGEISREEHDILSKNYKASAIETMKKLDGLEEK